MFRKRSKWVPHPSIHAHVHAHAHTHTHTHTLTHVPYLLMLSVPHKVTRCTPSPHPVVKTMPVPTQSCPSMNTWTVKVRLRFEGYITVKVRWRFEGYINTTQSYPSANTGIVEVLGRF